MTMVKALEDGIEELSDRLQSFGHQISVELTELKRSVKHRPVTGASTYKKCISDLHGRMSVLDNALADIGRITVDSVSTDVRCDLVP